MNILRIVDVIRYNRQPYYQVEYADHTISEDFLGFRFFIWRDSSDAIQLHNDMLRVLLDNQPAEPRKYIQEPIVEDFPQPLTMISDLINVEGMPHLFVNNKVWVPVHAFFEVDSEYAYVHPMLLHWISEQPYVRERDDYEVVRQPDSKESNTESENEEESDQGDDLSSIKSSASSDNEIVIDTGSDSDSDGNNF